jgi:hypothetical protein
MRDIGGYGPGRNGDRSDTLSGRFGRDASEGASVGDRGDQPTDRERAFASPELVDRFAALMHDRPGDHGGRGGSDEERSDRRAGPLEPGDRLLATVEGGTTPWPLTPDRPVPVDAVIGPRETGRAERIARHVDMAIKAELRPHANAPVRINLAVEDVPGLSGIVLSMTAAEIDLVLVRPATAAAALDTAAGDLADRLRNRFGKKVVRVYERTAETVTAGAVTAAAEADGASGGPRR